MSKILRRPMFKMGGSTNSGIMHGLVDRKRYSNAGIVERAGELIPGFEELLTEYTPKTRLPIGMLGANLVAGMPFKQAIQDPYKSFVSADDARRAGIKTGAAKIGIQQALAEAKPSNQSVLAAEKKARFLLPPNATAAEIRAKTAEIIRTEMTGKTYGPEANLERKINFYQTQYGDGSKAYNHAVFDIKIAPLIRQEGKNPRGNIKFKDGKYKTKNKSPGVYIDVDNGKVIEFYGNAAVELPELSALLR